jgi:hypothetical protein
MPWNRSSSISRLPGRAAAALANGSSVRKAAAGAGLETGWWNTVPGSAPNGSSAASPNGSVPRAPPGWLKLPNPEDAVAARGDGAVSASVTVIV